MLGKLEAPIRETVLGNAQIVGPDRVRRGGVLLRDGHIADVCDGTCRIGEDLEGDFLLPGLVDVHTDILERQLTPRPGVLWPSSLAAARAADALMVAGGVTTVLDSICAEAFPREASRVEVFRIAIQAVEQGNRLRVFRGEHLLHLRCETADPDVLRLFEPHADAFGLRLVSLMDHTPGQRQYRDVRAWRDFYKSEGWSDAEFMEAVQTCKDNQERYAAPHRRAIIALTRERGLPLASHDDACAAHVVQAHAEGAGICEFPTRLEAARQAAALGLSVVMGAPNVMLGKSHSGNVPALDVAREGLLDILASDYIPGSLVQAPFKLHEALGMPLPEAVSLVSRNPALAVGLDDRGEVRPGLRADLCRVRLVNGEAVVLGVWRGGRRIH